jgi:hypothetical protein
MGGSISPWSLVTMINIVAVGLIAVLGYPRGGPDPCGAAAGSLASAI